MTLITSGQELKALDGMNNLRLWMIGKLIDRVESSRCYK